jgi:hypothetical protein
LRKSRLPMGLHPYVGRKKYKSDPFGSLVCSLVRLKSEPAPIFFLHRPALRPLEISRPACIRSMGVGQPSWSFLTHTAPHAKGEELVEEEEKVVPFSEWLFGTAS